MPRFCILQDNSKVVGATEKYRVVVDYNKAGVTWATDVNTVPLGFPKSFSASKVIRRLGLENLSVLSDDLVQKKLQQNTTTTESK